jgi:FkbM family methyltransferase
MGNTSPSEAPSEPNPPRARGVRRRDLLAGGLGGLVGVASGVAAGRTLLAEPPPPNPPPGPAAENVVPDGARVSYAQFGEDIVAWSLFNGLGIRKPAYLDIGAYDPVASNNTYLFYRAGARGVLVEPNVALTERLRAVRPGDTVLVAGIGFTGQTEADFYVMTEPQWNTFDKEQAERLARETPQKIEKVVKMPLLNINAVFAEHFAGKAPDYLSIDIEGLEYAALKTLDFTRYRPKVVCADTLVTNTRRHHPETTPFMVANGYEVRGMTFANTFYVDKALLNG